MLIEKRNLINVEFRVGDWVSGEKKIGMYQRVTDVILILFKLDMG